jgi:LysM repeat protein
VTAGLVVEGEQLRASGGNGETSVVRGLQARRRRLTLAGLAVAALLGACAFTSPPHVAVTCTTPTTPGPNTYPMNFLWICNGTGTVTQGDAANGALGHLGGVEVGTASDAKNNMTSNKHYIYVFANITDYNSYCSKTADGNNTANPPIPACETILQNEGGLTTIDNQTGIDQTIIIENRVSGNISMAETAAHEAGHQLDSIYGISLYKSGLASAQARDFDFKLTGETVIYEGGPITAGDGMTLTFKGTSLSPVTISYTVKSTDTLSSIASGMAEAIRGNTTLTGSPVKMVPAASGPTLTIKTATILTYSQNTTGVDGHSANETQSLSNYDWPAFDAQNGCVINTGVFSGHQDQSGVFICSSLAQGTVGGTATAGDFVGVVVTDPELDPNPHRAAYVVQAGDTTTMIAAGVAKVINGDSIYRAAGITATSFGDVVNIVSGTNKSSYGPFLHGSGSETFSFSKAIPGGGPTLSNTYTSDNTNDAVLTQAWPYYFTNSAKVLWAELFAEETAIVAGQNVPQGATQDDYLGSGNFICSKFLVEILENSGSLPSQAQYPSACK